MPVTVPPRAPRSWWLREALAADPGEPAPPLRGSDDEIPAWAEKHDVDIWYRRGGDLGAASSPAQEGRWRDAVEAARRYGAADEYVELSASQVAERCRSPLFGSGVYTPNTANVQPARLARGLRSVLLEHGVRIFEGTPVRRFRPGPPAAAETPQGSVTAERAIL